MRTNTVVRRIAAAAAGLTLLGAGLVAMPTAAQAAAGCTAGNVCFYFNSGYSGASRNYAHSDSRMGDELFNRGGSDANGYGVQVANNSASVRNRSGKTVVVFKNRGCWKNNDSGIAIPPGADVNWGTSHWPGYKNNIASVKIGSEVCVNR